MKNMLLIALCFFLLSMNEKHFTDASQRISVVNESVWEISAIYVSEVDKNNWSNNLLTDSNMLSAGGGAMIIKTECGTYDVKLVDAENHTCVVRKIDICSNNQSFLISDQSIGTCLDN
jgi:hypothetical protein